MPRIQCDHPANGPHGLEWPEAGSAVEVSEATTGLEGMAFDRLVADLLRIPGFSEAPVAVSAPAPEAHDGGGEPTGDGDEDPDGEPTEGPDASDAGEAHDGGGEPEEIPLPPKAGPGASAAAWRAYAGAHGVEVPEDAKRDDIIAALEAASVPTE